MSVDTRPPAIALMGPTAAGKTALALEWAARFDGEIISVDSALIYRGLEIGAAKPNAEERARAPHHLLDVRDPWQPYSAAPILVGGTGLYFRALLNGLSPMPQADPAVRAQIAAEADQRGWPALHCELAAIDPDADPSANGSACRPSNRDCRCGQSN